MVVKRMLCMLVYVSSLVGIGTLKFIKQFLYLSELFALMRLLPKPTFEEAIRKWKSCKIDSADPVVILINRNNILDSVERAVKKHSFSWLKQVKVSFSGEEADDLGGPKREFFNLLMKEVKNLVGENGSLQHNLSKLEANVYYSAGRYIVWSILHGGGACKFLSTKVLDMLLGYNTELSIDDIADVDSKAFIIQLSEAETDNQMPVDWMLDIGLSPPFKVEKKEHLIKLALKQLQYYRIHAELQQFRKGLECFGFLDSIREYTDGIKSLLCASTERLSFAMFTENIQYNFSPVGSNYRREEENSVYALEAFIQDCCDDECEVVESEVLAFWTGTPEVPLHGFDKKLEVNFVNGIDLLPIAHTCDMSLDIPRGLTPDIFRNKMVTAVQWGGQFHLV
ncbi:G2/M phase-specific E3 ubiquitin-protein ligase-like [Mercenaria mercenaria]|uniref:G2/M phase-specific E3 ubiquitin-protein ligase-like n=1 Tax=Mercenaria mercenaria TaxID=6596 RepID=UPI00234F86A2|nr:G2/M phase-specific E3 ubiquitin-protein ligase-like [Mercenaria mercenaria]